MGRDKAPLKFNISDETFAPKKKAASKGKSDTKTIAVAAGLAEGFTPRFKNTKIDGRSLRRTNRGVQFNISVTQQTKDEFWSSAQDQNCTSGGEFLQILLDRFNKT